MTLAALKKKLKQLTAKRGKKRERGKKLRNLLARIKATLKRIAANVTKTRKRIRRKRRSGPLTMYDSVTVSAIPSDAKAVGCYVGPSIVTCPEVFRKFPNAHKVRITQAGMSTTPADCVDVEPGDATNTTGTAWVKRQLAAGHKRPIVYTSASNVKALLATLALSGVQRSQVRVWSAHYGRGEHICSPSVCGYPQADATQYTSTALGRNLDASKVSGGFF